MAKVILNLLVLKTPELEKLNQFYSALGVNFQAEQHGKGPTHYAGTIGEDLVLEIYPLSEGQGNAAVRLGFAVENLKESVRSLEAAGATIVTQPSQTSWGFQAIVRDPDGRAISITQPMSAPD